MAEITRTNVTKTTITLRGTATSQGSFRFYFKDRNGASLFRNRYWFTDAIPVGATHSSVGDMLKDATNVHCYEIVPEPFEDTSSIPLIDGWPSEYGIDVMFKAPEIVHTSDILGSKTVITFYTVAARFAYSDADSNTYYKWSEVSISMVQDDTLTGFGSLMITSDYSVYLSIPGHIDSTLPEGSEDFMSLNFMIDSWLVGDYSQNNEDLGAQAVYFKIPIYTGDVLADISERINIGQDDPDKYPSTCLPLVDQINNYFDRVSNSTGLFDLGSFNVVTTTTESLLEINITTISEKIQHQVSCFSHGVPETTISVICNSYFVEDNVYELRSYYDMYGIDKPAGGTASTNYKPLAFGFKFNLDYITEYSESETTSIDVTPIPGQSSAKAIGIDATGCIRDITLSGIRVDNSNIWMFHVPWQENGLNKGIIYTGTSNWGWVKFMKATLGTFQMTSGPYRLVMMTVPSSAQMQYYPTRDGKYQYSDGTYVLLAGWEDMCYVMIENFTYSRSEDMVNAIQYNLKMKRVAPLLAGR